MIRYKKETSKNKTINTEKEYQTKEGDRNE
jgi:hypothetical protein